MQFHLLFKDGGTDTHDAPCFGLTGRVDWKGCNPDLREEIDSWSESRGLNMSNEDAEGPALEEWLNTGDEAVVAIQLRNDDDFRNLFHKRMTPVWEYLVSESPFAPLFNQTAEQIIEQNYVNFLVNTSVPSEVQTSLHIWCRDIICKSGYSDTFSLLRPHMTGHLAFAVALLFPSLNRGSSYCSIGNEGISSNFSLAFWKNPDLSLLDHARWNMSEVMGYVMNINRVWTTPQLKDKLPASIVRDRLHNQSGQETVTGIFGPFEFHGLTNPVKSVLEILGE